MAVSTAPRRPAGVAGRVARLPAPGPSPLPALAGALSIAALLAYAVVALIRMHSPVELEWMEGGTAQHVQRVLSGQSVYGPPSPEFTPYLYTPLFYYVGAAFSAVLGAGLWPLRLVSFLASLALLAAVARLVLQETRSRWAALAGAGMLAACYRIGGAWFDLARVDTLCLALLLWALVLARSATGWRRAVPAAVLAALAVLTKQVALLPALAVLPHLARQGGRRPAAAYAVTLAGTLAVATAVLQRTSDGWFLFYAVRLPLHHKLVPAAAIGFWTSDLAGRLWPALGVIAAVATGAAVRWRRRRGMAHRRIGGAGPIATFHLPVGAALVLAAYASRLHSGGYDNVLLPAYVAVAVAFGLAVHTLDGALRRSPPHRSAPRRRRVAVAAGVAAVAAAFGVPGYNPAAQIPSRQAGAASALVAEIRDLPGPVYLPGHPLYLRRAGLASIAQTAAVEDVIRADIDGTGRRLMAALEARMAQRRYGALVVESDTRLTVLPPGTCHWYAPVGSLPAWQALLPVTGTRTSPRTIWLRRARPLLAPCRNGAGDGGGAGGGSGGGVATAG